MAGTVEYEDFYAICNHMPMGEKALRVGGRVVFPTSGWSASLKEHRRSGAPPTSPLTLELDLVIEPPPEGAPVIEVLTPLDLEEFRIDKPPIEYQDVFIHGDGEHGDGPGQVVVEHPQ